MKRLGSWALLLVCTMGVGGCRIKAGLSGIGGGDGSSSGNNNSSEQSGGSGGSASGGGGGGGQGGPSCNNLANHCLEEGEVFVGSQAFDSGYLNVSLAKQTGQPNAQGEAEYMKISSGETFTTKHVWQTRPATDADIQVGKLAIALDVSDAGIYRAARTREDAKSSSEWFLARIISVDTKPQGHVIVSGNYKVAVNAIRVPLQDDSPAITVSGAEDRHYVHEDYWFVGQSDLPTSGYGNVVLAAVIKPPAKETGNEGQFMLIPSGKIVWSKYAWKTRIASKEEVKTGVYAFMLDASTDGVYRAPQSREDAYGGGEWFVAKVVDTGQLYKGTVGVAGNYNVAIDAIRVRR